MGGRPGASCLCETCVSSQLCGPGRSGAQRKGPFPAAHLCLSPGQACQAPLAESLAPQIWAAASCTSFQHSHCMAGLGGLLCSTSLLPRPGVSARVSQPQRWWENRDSCLPCAWALTSPYCCPSASTRGPAMLTVVPGPQAGPTAADSSSSLGREPSPQPPRASPPPGPRQAQRPAAGCWLLSRASCLLLGAATVIPERA